MDDATNGVPDSFLSEWLKRNDEVISLPFFYAGGSFGCKGRCRKTRR